MMLGQAEQVGQRDDPVVRILEFPAVEAKRLVKVGKSIGDRVEILAGLSTGERIVTAGIEKVVDGSKME